MQFLDSTQPQQSHFIGIQPTLFDNLLLAPTPKFKPQTPKFKQSTPNSQQKFTRSQPNADKFAPNPKLLRSPFFYVGDKYKLMPQLCALFPREIDTYFEPFCGGGSSFLNVKARRYKLNDIDSHLIALHKFLQAASLDSEGFFAQIYALIKHYALSCSLLGIVPPPALRKEFKKTYFAHFNKAAYLALREDFNAQKDDISRLYLLLIYGFNRFLRFNARGKPYFIGDSANNVNFSILKVG